MALPASVGADATASFRFNVTAPAFPGTYNFQWRMAHGATLFGALSTNVQVANGHARSGRAAARPGGERVERLVGALDQRFHARVGAVAHPAGDAEASGFALERVAVADALDDAGDAQKARGHVKKRSSARRRRVRR